MKKRGLSPIISIVLIIGLVIASAAIVFTVVKNLSEEKLGEAKSCFDIIDTMEINEDYTCFNLSGPGDSFDSTMRVSISRKIVSLDYLLVAISSSNNSRTFRLNNSNTIVTGVTNYPSNTPGVTLPGNESGSTYIVSWDIGTPTNIKIAPFVNGKMCETLDEMPQIPVCI